MGNVGDGERDSSGGCSHDSELLCVVVHRVGSQAGAVAQMLQGWVEILETKQQVWRFYHFVPNSSTAVSTLAVSSIHLHVCNIS